MRSILFTINFLTNGGPSRVVENLVLGLNSKKYKITILTLIDENDPDVVDRLRCHGIKIVELKYQKSLRQVLKERQKIISIINSINADIIHTHGVVTTFLVASKKIAAKKITTIHNTMVEDYRYTYGKLKGHLIARAHLQKLKNFDKIICCSKSSYDSIKKYFDKDKISFIYNGIDVVPSKKRHQIREQYNFDANDIVYTYVGKINRLKRAVELAEMFIDNHLPNEKLLIVGDGDEKDKLPKNNCIIVAGFQKNIMDHLAASDIFISNSSSEGLPISVIEALASGLPCLLSEIPSHVEIVDTKTGVYLGETFTDKNFGKNLSKMRKKYQIINSEKITTFQKTYLSAKQMAKKYDHCYKILTGGEYA